MGCARGRSRDRRPVWAVLATAAIVSIAAAACNEAAEKPEGYPKGTIAAILAADGRFDTLMSIIEQDAPRVFLDSLTTVEAGGQEIDITWFAPTDEAFAAVPSEVLDALLQDDNVGDLQTVLDHHTILRAYSLAELMSKAESIQPKVQPIGGGPISLTLVDGELHVDDATVIDGDIDAANGVIHVINALMVPDSVPIG